LPIGLALLIFQVGKLFRSQGTWWAVLLLLVSFVPLVGVLVFSQSLGSALALPIAVLFILALSIRQRRTLLIGGGVLLVLAVVGGIALRHPITNLITSWHSNSKGISTFSKRYYLWQVALNMIHDHLVFGVGLDNWLCHYALNPDCPASATQHLYTINYSNGIWTGLSDEPRLSHPHEIFLQVWVSMGIFGLLAFLAILALFFWLFARIVRTISRSTRPEVAGLEWIVLGIGGALLAALCQGLIDSSFLEQDLAFCFWMLVAALLILRVFTGTPWRGKIS
jgi:O-antigen ligase